MASQALLLSYPAMWFHIRGKQNVNLWMSEMSPPGT